MRFFRSKEEKELDNIISRLEMNMSNNYKDNAQANLKELEETLKAFSESGKVKESIISKYDGTLADYQTRLKGYTHNNQKPYWT